MSKYFESFPTIEYNGQTIRNLLTRVKMLDSVKKTSAIYHPFTILDGETPEKIAYDYYGNVDYAWIIFYANDISDPYFDWPLSSLDLDEYVKQKYGSIQAAMATTAYFKKQPLVYYVNPNNNEDYFISTLFSGNATQYTRVEVDENVKVSADTTGLDPAIWSEIDCYTDELNKNEEKRNIRLIDKAYVQTMARDLKNLLNND